MKTADVFPSKYLNAEDATFDKGEIVVTIKDVVKESMNTRSNGEQEKAVMYFRELPKGLVMNKTNWNICAKLFGSDDSDDWIGNKVSMNSIETTAYGETVKGIRISDRKPKVDKQVLIDRYSQLFERARQLHIEGVENYAISPNMDESEITDLGRELQKKITAAEIFA